MAKKNFQMSLKVLTPVHIGSGEKLLKKEYIRIPSKNRETEILVPDITKLYSLFKDKERAECFEKYLFSSDTEKRDLFELLSENGIRPEDISDCISYRYSVNLDEDSKKQFHEINTFIKDAFGKPYIPGSSLKGMLRTAILFYRIAENLNNYTAIKADIMRTIKPNEEEINRHRNGQGKKETGRRYLQSSNSATEQKAFHTLKKINKPYNALNSVFQGLIVSDSEPLEPSDLILGQKIDVTLSGKEKNLPIFREMLKPGIDVRFSITLDESICGFSMEEIFKALNRFHELNDEIFYSRFRRRNVGENIVYLGGGVGFSSKTVVDALFPKKDEAVEVKNNIFKEILGDKYQEHHHGEDINLKIAPHVCKCTRYDNRLYNVGICQLIKKPEEEIG